MWNFWRDKKTSEEWRFSYKEAFKSYVQHIYDLKKLFDGKNGKTSNLYQSTYWYLNDVNNVSHARSPGRERTPLL